jgi:hypothetical protein
LHILPFYRVKGVVQCRVHCRVAVVDSSYRWVSGILPGYSCKKGRIVEAGLLVEFPCTPTRTRSVYSY